MKKIVFGVLIIMHFSCNGQSGAGTVNTANESNDRFNKEHIKTLKELKLEDDSQKSYDVIKNSIKEKKLNLKNKKLSNDSLGALFKTSLVNRIIPFWEGTEWSFEGHTSTPGKGQIACGYFVSTTLKDVGVNLNRYRLAQQSPINEANSLALNAKVIAISENSKEENISKINATLKNGIHFIGFDSSHVGYLLKEKGQLYLIHSNYIDSKGVEIEKIELSAVFASYNRYYIVELSTNEKLLKSWMNGNEIKVINKK